MNFPISLSLSRAAVGAVFMGCVTGATALNAAVIVTYFPMTVTTASGPGAGQSAVAYNLGRLNDGYYEEAGAEYGAQVTLGSGAATVFKGLSFAYFSDYNQIGGLTYRLYRNDGPLVNGQASPGTLDYTDTVDLIGNPGGSITVFSTSFAYDVANQLTTTFTLTLQYDGVDSTHHAGTVTSDADPTVGSHPYTFWRSIDGGSTWYLSTLIQVPEPNIATVVGVSLALVGGVRICRKLKR